jgi:acetate kinase
MKLTTPQQITPKLLTELKAISSYDPEHLPEEIKLIEVFAKHYPELPQVACFDTTFTPQCRQSQSCCRYQENIFQPVFSDMVFMDFLMRG